MGVLPARIEADMKRKRQETTIHLHKESSLFKRNPGGDECPVHRLFCVSEFRCSPVRPTPPPGSPQRTAASWTTRAGVRSRREVVRDCRLRNLHHQPQRARFCPQSHLAFQVRSRAYLIRRCAQINLAQHSRNQSPFVSSCCPYKRQHEDTKHAMTHQELFPKEEGFAC